MTDRRPVGRSLNAKVTRVNLGITGLALVLAAALVVGIDFFRMRDSLLQDLRVQASMIAANSAAALAFADAPACSEVLSALAASRSVVYAAVLKDDGSVFATYAAAHVSAPTAAPPTPIPAYRFTARSIQFTQPIVQDGQRLGTLYIEADLTGVYQRLLMSSGIDAAIVVFVLTVSLLALQRLRRALTRTEKDLERMAHFDSVTQLPNRNTFNEVLGAAIARANRTGGKVGLLFLDLDRFKVVNDTLGHEFGDKLLLAVGGRLSAAVRQTDRVFRIGGDEFTVIIEGVSGREALVAVAEHLIAAFKQTVKIEEMEVYIGASVGLSMYPSDGADVATIVRNADAAMYYAKDQGRGNYQFFTPTMNDRAKERMSVEYQLRNALANDEFELHYQPQVDLDTGLIVAAEALIRWNSPGSKQIGPAEFIPVAEETGLIVPIGEWVLRTACAQARAWQDPEHPPIPVSVNLSGRQFSKSDLPQAIECILAETGLPHSLLELEITESVLMDNTTATVDLLRQLRALGIQVAIDDFGTGYSSMSYLKRFPIGRLKIDRTFVCDIPEDTDDVAITAAIIAMAKNLKIAVVAEGVETSQQVAFLKAHGCGWAQGYYFSRPVPAAQMHALLAAQRSARAKLPGPTAAPEKVTPLRLVRT